VDPTIQQVSWPNFVLPTEILAHIFAFITSFASLGRCILVSQYWCNAAASPLVQNIILENMNFLGRPLTFKLQLKSQRIKMDAKVSLNQKMIDAIVSDNHILLRTLLEKEPEYGCWLKCANVTLHDRGFNREIAVNDRRCSLLLLANNMRSVGCWKYFAVWLFDLAQEQKSLPRGSICKEVEYLVEVKEHMVLEEAIWRFPISHSNWPFLKVLLSEWRPPKTKNILEELKAKQCPAEIIQDFSDKTYTPLFK